MSEHNLILEFYKPTYNLDFGYDGDGGLDLHFTNIKGEFFMTMNDSYNSVYIEDEDCEFSKGEMFATVDLGDLVERIINGEFRQTNGKAFSDWGKRFIGDGEEQIEFNGKNYADGSLFWDDFFKEMSKDEIKDFMTFCEDYLDLPNIEVDTVSDKYDFENGKVELKSNGKWGITVNDDYTIISVDKFTCNSTDACDAYDVASSESDGDDYYESKKSVKRSLKEEKVTDSLFQNIVFSMIKKFKLKKEYDVERPSWSVFNFRHKNKDTQFAITFDERGHGDFLYGEVLAFGDEKDDIFKYKTDEVKVDSYNIEKECSNIIANCLAFIDANKKITIFESEKSAKKSLKEYLVKGLDVDFVVDHLFSLEDPNNFDLINELSDLWELYKKSWNKFNKSLSDFWKVMKNIEKLDSFDKTCKEIIDAWYDDIEKIFYSDDNLENLKLNYGFEGNDIF